MPIEGQVKFSSPQNTAGASQGKGAVVTSQATVANGNEVSNKQKPKIKK